MIVLNGIFIIIMIYNILIAKLLELQSVLQKVLKIVIKKIPIISKILRIKSVSKERIVYLWDVALRFSKRNIRKYRK